MDTDFTNTRVKFRHLQCFLAVTQLGSVQRAADSLSITQPAVSKTIGELESILGVRLFERGRRGAVPTREGRLFAPHASACVASLREGVDMLLRERGTCRARYRSACCRRSPTRCCRPRSPRSGSNGRRSR